MTPPDQKALEAACREADALSETRGGPVEALRELGADPQAVIAVAQQRGLRAYAYITGQIAGPLGDDEIPVAVRVTDTSLLAALVGAFMDGFACALAAARDNGR